MTQEDRKGFFGASSDPRDLSPRTYVTAANVIQQLVYAVLSKIFSYETAGSPFALDSDIAAWATDFYRENAVGVVPFFHRFQVRSGASNAILGYFGKNGTSGQPVLALLGANGLKFMLPTLIARTASSLPLALNVSAIDYDEDLSLLISNHDGPINAARKLNFPVLSPVSSQSGLELQHMLVLNHYLVSVSNNPSVFLVDGPPIFQTIQKFDDIMLVSELGALYGSLLESPTAASEDAGAIVDTALANLNAIAGTNYSQFEYEGPPAPETVVVVYGAHATTQLAGVISRNENSNVGIIKVRVPTPFNSQKFVSAIPESARRLLVLAESSASSLTADVAASLFLNGVFSISVNEYRVPIDFVYTPATILKLLEANKVSASVCAPTYQSSLPITANTSPTGQYLFWGKESGSLVDASRKLALSMSLDDSKLIVYRKTLDSSHLGGVFQGLVSSVPNGEVSPAVDAADVVVIEDISLLDEYDILASVKPGAKVLLINSKPIPNSIAEDVVPKLPIRFRRDLATLDATLFLVDTSTVPELDAANASTAGFSVDFLIQVAFWRAALPELNGFIVNKLLQANGNEFELLAAVLDKFIQAVDEFKSLKAVQVMPEWKELTDEEEVPELPFFPTETSFSRNLRSEDNAETVRHEGYKTLATTVVFPEAYNARKELRPDLPVQNFVVKVQQHQRLTPTEYSRNIFHIEFDTTGTNLKYEIGEALGIHGRNNSQDVEAFLDFYDVDGDSILQIPSKDNPDILEVRSARQALIETVDFLGKPPKRFYESLTAFASDSDQRAHLENLASPTGAAELKRRQDEDFDTYVDVLREFHSARPSFTDLIGMISPLKRREYSIASSQRMHPNAVHLLIVVVDWIDPRGRIRYGHCSKYLSDLEIGDELVVSVKPSVMKLPPLSTQPIIMSGLGTGLAPFKAFIEEKVWQKQQGMEIGEIYLYLGSRHKKEEYLYGEFWEAHKDAGVLTHIGAAFSRDQPEKIYIQDKIRESIGDLTQAIASKNGSFYLCGPTWPVPDITACLEDIVLTAAQEQGETIKDVAKVVEDMKEEGRYVLEVY